MGTLFIQFSSGSLTTIAPTIITNVPRYPLIYCGLSGVFGWVIYWIYVQMGGSVILGPLLGSLGVAFISDLFSEHLGMPATIFNIPGVVPLVPGGLAYQAVRSLITESYQEAAHYAVQAIMVARAIVLGPVLSEVSNHSIRSFKVKRDAIMLERKKRLFK